MASDLLFRAFANMKEYDLTTNQVIVLLMLCDRTNQDSGQCNPSRETLAACTKLSVRSVSRAIVELEEKGFVTCIRRNRTSTKYQIHLPEFAGQPVPRHETHSPANQNMGDTQSRDTGHTVPRHETACPVTRDTVARKPIKEPIYEPTIELLKEEARAKNKYVSYESLGLTSLPKRWADWLAQAYPTFVPDRVFDQFSSFWNKTAATKTLDGWFEQFRKSTNGIPPSLHEYMTGIVDEKPGKAAPKAKPKHQAYMDGPVYSLEEMGLA